MIAMKKRNKIKAALLATATVALAGGAFIAAGEPQTTRAGYSQTPQVRSTPRGAVDHPSLDHLARLSLALAESPGTGDVADRIAWVESLVRIGQHDRARTMLEQIMTDLPPEQDTLAFHQTLEALRH